MSTPSTATATHPSHHPHYGYSHHQIGYQSNGAYPATNTPTGSARLANSYAYPANTPTASTTSTMTTAQSHPLPPVPQSAPTPTNPTYNTTNNDSMSSGTSTRRRKPNWEEFYKNGLPKEVIIIDDSPPPDQTTGTRLAVTSTTTTTINGQPAGKRRRTGLESAYDVSYHDRPSFSTNPQPYWENSSHNSLSTDRTTSLQTTAPTSLGSAGSVGTNNGVVYEDANVGQKRKRNTRTSTRQEAKRRELEAVSDAFLSYIPPPQPPIKAKEVPVPVIRDYSYGKHEKVDDDDGHYIVQPDTPLTDRYSIIRLLGQGTFGKVVEAYDKQRKMHCAVKIIRSVQKYRDASKIELRVLSTLASNDKTNRNKCIHLRDCFDFRNHICIVTDLLGQSVFDFLKSNSFVPFPSSQIQNFARQLFTSVAFLHDLNLIHTDLKPENILLVSNSYQTFTYNRTIPSSSHTTARNARHRRVLLDSEIRLIDFGSATFDDEYHSSVVSTRHYRAPEIILNLGWSFPCDIWSIGCILVEFFTGDALFQTHDNLEHLAMMESVIGSRIDPKMVKQVVQGRGNSSNQAAKYFNRNKLDYPNEETTRASRKYVKAMKQLHEFIPQNHAFNKQFLDLLQKIFVYDPKQRLTAKQALKHPWFKETIVDDGTEAVRLAKFHSRLA
ncbi:protein kinase (Lkh1), putative [Talaromyces stipitatus ATCC 10500]|uniref:dual-specificity kinase n=1 Tax=Talaromyces stipitatus (strain ATCC 10500 / CBS 375.48 / QM 6759 / NRRL 1006) TaxID=441959 RepID=B8M3H8_TALSN|nr:protein kinase (Lkh1), putative [Talaromyces stipitatus ATCC 10500]EED22350.1 protein kinase (Lkh1), putative [Talaromyces stipitatus ATCC 10500]